MNLNINEFLEEQRKGLAELLESLSKSRLLAARSAARESAARIKMLNERVRALAQSGVRLTAVSHGAVRDIIELHADIVNSALTDAATQLERMAYTESVRDLARMQTEVLAAARQRIVADMARAVTILKDAAGDARKAVAPVTEPAKPARRKAAAPAKPRAKVATKAKAKSTARAKAGPKRSARPAAKRKSGRRPARG
jgi:hypothetical protein